VRVLHPFFSLAIWPKTKEIFPISWKGSTELTCRSNCIICHSYSDGLFSLFSASLEQNANFFHFSSFLIDLGLPTTSCNAQGFLLYRSSASWQCFSLVLECTATIFLAPFGFLVGVSGDSVQTGIAAARQLVRQVVFLATSLFLFFSARFPICTILAQFGRGCRKYAPLCAISHLRSFMKLPDSRNVSSSFCSPLFFIQDAFNMF
jgi:hypothetical protein